MKSEGGRWTVSLYRKYEHFQLDLHNKSHKTLLFGNLSCQISPQVIQRRMDGSVNFYRPWDQYKVGFGSAAGEYWLGEKLNQTMTSCSASTGKFILGCFKGGSDRVLNLRSRRSSVLAVDQWTSSYPCRSVGGLMGVRPSSLHVSCGLGEGLRPWTS